uniref:Uncharacterized protein n=1 Tax=Lygus hesperus TaxID=30085 RepID=A0A0A9Z1G5_LYGHE
MAWMEVSWYAVHPIRFWYIFHQAFPISVRWSHLLVSANLLIIGIFEYFVTIFVKDRDVNDPFSNTFYPVMFGILALACIVWLIGGFFVKRFLNPVSAEFNAVREVYARSEVIEEFDRKQSIINFILFPLVMIPALIIPIMNVLIDLSHYYLPLGVVHLDIGLVPYRPHLICFLLSIIVTEVVLQFLKFIRTEYINLTLIAISHILNIFALLVFMYILHNTIIVRTRNPNEDDGIFLFFVAVRPRYFTQLGGLTLHYGQSYQLIRDVPADGLVTIRLTDYFTGEVYTDQKLQINVSHGLSSNLFHVMNYTGRRLQVIKTPSPPITYVPNTRIVLMNGLEECNNFVNPAMVNRMFKADEMRGMLLGNLCLPISYLFYPNGTDFKKATPFKPPANNESIEFEIPCLRDYKSAVIVDRPYFGKTLTCNDAMVLRYNKLLTYLIRSKIVASPAEFIYWPVFFYFEIFEYSLIFSRVEDNWWDAFRRTPTPNNGDMTYFRSEKEIRLIMAEVLYGISLGIGLVGYMHLLWMQCPMKFRILIIFSFFAMMFAALSLAKRYLTDFDETQCLAC